jgi:hypothetical protein
VRAGWVARLDPGAPQAERAVTARFQSRVTGIATFLGKLDERHIRATAHPRDLLAFDGEALEMGSRIGPDARAAAILARAKAARPATDPDQRWVERWPALAGDVIALTLAGTLTRDQPMREHAARLLLEASAGKARLAPRLPNTLDARAGLTALGPLHAYCDAARVLHLHGQLPRERFREVRAWADELLAWLQASPTGRDARDAPGLDGTLHDLATVVLAASVGRPNVMIEAVHGAIRRARAQFDATGLVGGTPDEQLSTLLAWTSLARYGAVVGEPLWSGMRTGRASPASAVVDFVASAPPVDPAALSVLRHLSGLPVPDVDRLARSHPTFADQPLIQPFWWLLTRANAPRVVRAPAA